MGIMDEFLIVLREFFGELGEFFWVGGREFIFLFNLTGDPEDLDIGQGGVFIFLRVIQCGCGCNHFRDSDSGSAAT